MTLRLKTPQVQAPKLLFLVTEDWYFCSHRLQLAKTARAEGFDVTVACRVKSHSQIITEAGLKLEPLSWARESRGLRGHIRAIRQIVEVYRRVQPNILHHVALKPILFGALGAWLAFGQTRRPYIIAAIAGLGSSFTIEGLRARVLRVSIAYAIRLLHAKTRAIFLFQNTDDRDILVRLRAIEAENCAIIRGAGVDTERFQPRDKTPGTGAIKFAIVSRMLRIKGIEDAVAASLELDARNINHELHLFGEPDPANPASYTPSEMAAFEAAPHVRLHGHTSNPAEVWAEMDVGVQPSWGGEGLPKAILEAAATGLPLIVTDVPGCREIVRKNENGILVAPKAPLALADAMQTLTQDANLRRRMGEISRSLVLHEFSSTQTVTATLALYDAALKSV